MRRTSASVLPASGYQGLTSGEQLDDVDELPDQHIAQELQTDQQE